MKIKSLIALLIIPVILMTGCSKKTNAKASSMEDIYKEQGVPIKVVSIETKTFTKDLNFNVNLTGLKETSVTSMVSDQVSNIRVSIGSSVRKDQILMEFPNSNPSVSYRQADAAYKLAKQTYDRMNNLYKNGGISKQELDGAETQLNVSHANLDAVSQIVKVRAPIDGIVTDLNVKTNERVKSGDMLCTISQLSNLKGRIWITEKEIGFIKKGTTLSFNWNGKDYNGRITEIALSLNQDKQAFGADIEVRNANNELRSGINGQASLNVVNIPGAIVIPRNLIQTDEDKKAYVFVADNNKAIKKYIETGLENNLEIQVTSGLNQGDLLVTEGYNLLDNGFKVKVVN